MPPLFLSVIVRFYAEVGDFYRVFSIRSNYRYAIVVVRAFHKTPFLVYLKRTVRQTKVKCCFNIHVTVHTHPHNL